MAVKDGQIGLSADFNRADSVGQPQFPRGIPRNGLQRGFRRHAAVANRLGGFLRQMPNQLMIVAFDHSIGAGFVQQGGISRRRIVGFDLVGPPIGERAAACTVRHDLRRDFVSFQDMLQRPDSHAVLCCNPEQHQDLIRTITMAVDKNLVIDNACQCLQP